MQAALDDINLIINPGDIFGIIGKSGAGKSTLLRTLNLLVQPDSGLIKIDDQSILDLNAKQLIALRQKMGMIFQHFNLLESKTVFDNIALPLKLAKQSNAKIKTRVDELLSIVDLTEHALKYPCNLSGGQKQRVAIARALALNPQILLCDEATSALDPESTQSILTLLKDINSKLKITIVLITHEMDVVKTICNRMAVIDKAKIVEEGRVIDIFAEPKSTQTKALIQATTHLNMPDNLRSQLSNEQSGDKTPLIRLAFIGEEATAAVISKLQDQFNVSANILQANLETLQNQSIGFMLCHLQGEVGDIEKALDFIRSLSIKVEVLGYV